MAGFVLRVRLFISSYAPLFAILALRFRDPELAATCAVVAALGTGTLLLMLRRARSIEPNAHQVEAVSDQGAEVAGYLATYLLPFLTVPEPSVREALAYGLFFLVVGIVYVRSEMVQINPLLYLLGYRVWGLVTGDGWRGYLISRRRPRAGMTLLASRLANTVAVEQRHERSMASGS